MEDPTTSSGSANVEVVGRSFVAVIVPLSFEKHHYARVRASMIDNMNGGWELNRRVRSSLMEHLAQQVAGDNEYRPGELLSWWGRTKGTHDPRPGPMVLQAGAKPDFRIEQLELALFDMGLGFLVIFVATDSSDTGAWQDLLHHLRFVAGRRAPTVMHQDENISWTTVIEGVLDSLGDGLAVRSDPPLGYFGVALKSNGNSDAATRDQVHFRRMFPGGRESKSSFVGEDLFGEPLAYGQNMAFHFSLDGGGFVAVDPPSTDFFKVQLFDHLRSTYLLALIFAYAQRIALIDLSTYLIESQAIGEARSLARRVHDLRALERDLVRTVTRSRFAQVLPTQNHHTVYLHWKRVFELDELETEVANEVAAVRGQLSLELEEERAAAARASARSAERLERKLTILGTAFASGSLAAALLGVNISHFTSGSGARLSVVLILLISFVILGAIAGWIITKSREFARHPSTQEEVAADADD